VNRTDSLRSLLEDYLASTEREVRQQRRMLELLKHDDAPFSRSSLSPGHFTASSFVIDHRCEQILLILHRTLGLWLQPGGHFENSDQSVETAARREVFEETGIRNLKKLATWSGLFDIDIHTIPANPARGEPEHEHFDLRMAFMASRNQLETSSEVLEARWVPFNEVAGLGSDDSVIRCVQSLHRRKEAFSDLRKLI
jgi:8-oxo-dGTP pyrophosphatase MutT (NUDIX family)